MRLSGADIVIRTLIEQGCDVAFGYPGGQVLPLYDALYRHRSELKHILTAHEQGAAHAADGYARATGKVGVVFATSGPGATNLVTGIATAHMDSVPLIAITGNVPSYQIGTDSFQEIDITGITLPITKHNYVVGCVEEIADTVREAFVIARSGRPGPVLIDIPKDVQEAFCDYTPQPPVELRERRAAKQTRIEAAAACLKQAKRPCIYFGGGILSADAQEELTILAERLDAPMCCSLMGISAIPTEHPRFLGMQGMHGHYAASMAMYEADCILSLGVRFNDRATGKRELFAQNAKVVHIDTDGSELGKTVPAACALRGNLKTTLQQLLPLLPQKRHPTWQSRIAALRQTEEELSDKRDGLTPRTALLTLNRYLGENTPVATDVGQHQMWAAQTLVFRKKRRFLSSGGLGTMGFGLGACIGAAVGVGETAVLVTGDGSFGMSLQELATAVTYRVPLVILLLNNGVLGMVRQWQTLFYEKRYSETVLERQTDFVQVVKAFGGDGERVSTEEQLDRALKTAFSGQGVYLIDCLIDKDEWVLPMLPPDGTVAELITRK